MNRPLSPIRVTSPPPAVPGFIVTCSRIVLLRPITSEDFSPAYLRSCGSKPIEANGKMRVRSPIVVSPSTTTWAISLTPASSTTSAPTTQYGPIATSSANVAPGATIAVGWICGMRNLIVEDHRGEDCLGHQLAADFGAAFEFPDVAAVALLRDTNMKAIAGKNRAAETGVIDTHEINQLALRFAPEGMDDQHGRRLRHRLDDQDARHYRPAREVTLKIMLVDRDVLDAGGPHIRHRIDDLVDHQKRIAVRDHFHDPLDIDLGGLLFGEGRIDHRPSFFFARRCRIATCLMNEAIGTAGLPQTVSPGAMSRITPALPAMRAPLPISRWPAKPACPPTITKSPSFVLPEIPT